MIAAQYLAFGAVSFQVISVSVVSDDWPLQLLKRQEPGTPAYNCHDNCGQAIIGSRSAGYCTSPTWNFDYTNCLQCAGPDNFDIWTMYGSTLTKAATSCGLSTTPLSGKQPDPPAASPAGGSITPSSTSPSFAPSSTATSSASSVTPSPTEASASTGSLAATTPGSVTSSSGVVQGTGSLTTSSVLPGFTSAAGSIFPNVVALVVVAAGMAVGIGA